MTNHLKYTYGLTPIGSMKMIIWLNLDFELKLIILLSVICVGMFMLFNYIDNEQNEGINCINQFLAFNELSFNVVNDLQSTANIIKKQTLQQVLFMIRLIKWIVQWIVYHFNFTCQCWLFPFLFPFFAGWMLKMQQLIVIITKKKVNKSTRKLITIKCVQ